MNTENQNTAHPKCFMCGERRESCASLACPGSEPAALPADTLIRACFAALTTGGPVGADDALRMLRHYVEAPSTKRSFDHGINEMDALSADKTAGFMQWSGEQLQMVNNFRDARVAGSANHHINEVGAPLAHEPDGLVEWSKEHFQMLNFLYGSGVWDGVWFEQKHPTKQGAFWWRADLRRLFSSPEAALAQEHYKEVVDGVRQLFAQKRQRTSESSAENNPENNSAQPVSVTKTHPLPPGWMLALNAAVSALYFDDGKDFRSSLGAVIRHLDPQLAGVMLGHPKAAFDQVQAMLAAASEPSIEPEAAPTVGPMVAPSVHPKQPQQQSAWQVADDMAAMLRSHRDIKGAEIAEAIRDSIAALSSAVQPEPGESLFRHRVRVHLANRNFYSRSEFCEKLEALLHETKPHETKPADQPAVHLTADDMREPKNGKNWRVDWWNEVCRMMLPSDMVLDSARSHKNGTIQFTIKRRPAAT